MQCVTHIEQEAVDVCRSCGKPICSECEARTHGPGRCGVCCTESGEAAPLAAPPAVSPAAPSGRLRSPLLAALLSTLPGLGQIYNGTPLKALAVIAALGTLIFAVTRSAAVAPFLGFFWLFQVGEAYLSAQPMRPASAADAATQGEGSTFAALALLVAGTLLLLQNLTGLLLRQGAYLIPLAVIGSGLALLISYFRSAPESGS